MLTDEILKYLDDGRKRTRRQIIDAIPALTTLYSARVPLDELLRSGSLETEKCNGVNLFWRSGVRAVSAARAPVGPMWRQLVAA